MSLIYHQIAKIQVIKNIKKSNAKPYFSITYILITDIYHQHLQNNKIFPT